jgi:hypothetical protein
MNENLHTVPGGWNLYKVCGYTVFCLLQKWQTGKCDYILMGSDSGYKTPNSWVFGLCPL